MGRLTSLFTTWERFDAARLLANGVCIALLASWLGFYLITGMPQFELDAFKATVLLHVVTALMIIPYLSYLIISHRLPGGTPLDWAIVAVVAGYLLATVASVNWRVSLENTLMIVMAVAIFYVLMDVRFLRGQQIIAALLIATTAASIYALWLVEHDYVQWLRLAESVKGGIGIGDLIPPTVPRVRDVSDNPNILAMCLATVLPLYLVTVYRRGIVWVRVAAATGFMIAILTLFFTLSRGAWLGSVAGVAVTAVGIALVVRSGGERWVYWWRLSLRRRRVAALALAFVLIVLLAASAFVASARWDTRPQWLFRGSASPRYDAMSAAVEMFRDHPVLGAGPNTFALLYPEYSGEYPVHAIHAHDGFLQAAVDLGALGLIAVVFLGWAFARQLWYGLKGASSTDKLTVVACSGAFGALLVHSLVDTPNVWKAPLVTMAVISAIALRAVGSGSNAITSSEAARSQAASFFRRLLSSKGFRLFPRVMVAALIPVLLLAWVWIDSAHFYFSQGLANADARNWPAAISNAEKAADIDPNFALYWFQLGLAEGESYVEGDGSGNALLEQSIQHLRKGLSLEPRSAIGYANLAMALSLAGEEDAARAAALDAERLASGDVAILIVAGTVLEDAGFTTEAIDAYASAVFENRDLIDSPFWTLTQFRRDSYREILNRSTLTFDPCGLARLLVRSGGDLLLDSGYVLPGAEEDCRLRVWANPDDLQSRIALAEVQIKQGQMKEAFDHLDFALNRQPDNGPARTVLGMWYAAQGEIDKAREQWLLASQLDEPEAVILLGDSYPPGQVPANVMERLGQLLPAAGSAVQLDIVSILYYRAKFARGTPITLLIPGGWQEAVPARYAAVEDALRRWQAAKNTSPQ